MSFEEQLRRTFDAALTAVAETARAERERAREEGREEGRSQAVAPPIDSGAMERLLDGIQAIDRARGLTGVLDALADCAGREAARSGVLLARDGQLRGWRFVGFDESGGDAASVEMGLADAGVVAEAIGARAAVRSAAVPGFARRGGGDPDGGSFAVPVEIAGEIVAVLYADDPTEGGLPAASYEAMEILARHASRALEALVGLKAARQLTEPAERPDLPADGGGSDKDKDDDDAAARRYARLLVSEIKLYHEPAVVAGRRDGDLAARLGGEIARARSMYEQRVPAAVRQRTDYFHDELVQTLADGDSSLLHLI